MGCYDEYCSCCGAPFISYTSWKIPQLEGIDTEWLKDALMEFYSGEQVEVCYYDGYGRFEDNKGVSYDVIDEDTLERKARVYHKACSGSRSSDITRIKKYQQQEFAIDAMIADNAQNLLMKPEA